MMERYWSKAELTPAGRPVMMVEKDELTLTVQHGVGLYFGSERLKTHDDGALYITTHRLIWIPSLSMPSASAVYLPLSSIIDINDKPGFLTSHPKTTLVVSLPPKETPAHGKLDQTLAPKWICTVCATQVIVSMKSCSECGVPRSNDATLVCHKCTFHNPPTVKECQMCVTILTTNLINLSIESASVSTTNSASFKLSFRQGGQSSVQQALQGAMKGRAWLKESKSSMLSPTSLSSNNIASSSSTRQLKPVGVSGIMQAVEENQKQTDSALSNAFEDLDSLMKKAAEMVELAETIKTKLAKSSNEEADNKENSELQSFFLDLGISSPVTKETSGSQYYMELSKQLCDFMSPLFPKLGPIILLTDVYCLFNRARGVSLVSPDDLLRAATLLGKITQQMSLKKFPTGVLAIQSAAFRPEEGADRIRQELSRADIYYTIMDVMEKEKVSRTVASEMLETAEKKGWICRDETFLQGVRYYRNLILEYIT